MGQRLTNKAWLHLKENFPDDIDKLTCVNFKINKSNITFFARRHYRVRKGQKIKPVPIAACGAHGMWQGSAQRQHADQPAERFTRPVGGPAHHQLHAERIDSRQREARDEAVQAAVDDAVRRESESRIGDGSEQRTGGEDVAGGIAVGEPRKGEEQGPANEPELDRAGQRAELGKIEPELI